MYSKMTGIEFMVSDVMEPHLFVIRKQKRDGPEKVTPMLTYYVLDGSIYQAPQLCNVFSARVVRVASLFSTFCWVGYMGVLGTTRDIWVVTWNTFFANY